MPTKPNLTHIKRFYKKVEVIEHPLSETLPKLNGENVTLQNLHLADKYFAVALDGRVTKTLYKDDLCIPSRALAVAIAEEWDMQGEKIDLKTLKINQMIAKAIRSFHDPTLVTWMRTEIQNILENDQACQQDDLSAQNEYKQKLAQKQKELYSPLLEFMNEQF